MIFRGQGDLFLFTLCSTFGCKFIYSDCLLRERYFLEVYRLFQQLLHYCMEQQYCHPIYMHESSQPATDLIFCLISKVYIFSLVTRCFGYIMIIIYLHCDYF